jgi:hypothetical protein
VRLGYDNPRSRGNAACRAAADYDGLVSLGLRTWAPGGADAEIAAMMRGAVSSWFQRLFGQRQSRTPHRGLRDLGAYGIGSGSAAIRLLSSGVNPPR